MRHRCLRGLPLFLSFVLGVVPQQHGWLTVLEATLLQNVAVTSSWFIREGLARLCRIKSVLFVDFGDVWSSWRSLGGKAVSDLLNTRLSCIVPSPQGLGIGAGAIFLVVEILGGLPTSVVIFHVNFGDSMAVRCAGGIGLQS